MKSYYEAMVMYRKEMMDRIRWATGDKREGLIEAMQILADIEAIAAGVKKQEGRDGSRAG